MQTICDFLAKKVAYLPQKLLDVAGELGFLRPAIVLEGLADVTLHIGRHGTGAVVVLVITLAGIDMDEVVLDGTLHPSWHVVIDGGEADGHADRFVFGKQRTALTLHLGIVQVDTVGVKSVLGLVTGEQAVKAMLTKGADCTVADAVVVCFFSEDLLSGLWCLIFLLHIGYKSNHFVGVKQIFSAKKL